MAKDTKKKPSPEKKKKVTSEDVPGSGLAKKAARAMEDYHKRLEAASRGY